MCTYQRFPVHQKINIPIGCAMRCEHDKQKQQQKLHKTLGERPREPTETEHHEEKSEESTPARSFAQNTTKLDVHFH